MKSNQDIRDYAASHKVLLWECAEKLGMADTTFSKKMRRELPRKEKQKIPPVRLDFSANSPCLF